MVMAAKKSKRLVIDASAARAAGGEDASHPASKLYRDFLLAVLTICHQIIITSKIGQEWERHQSRFTRRWLRSMTARKKVNRLESLVAYDLRGQIERSAEQLRSAEREALRKDFLLVEAAIVTDRVVIALDDVAWALFATVSRSVGELRNIAWVNPARTEEEPIAWLRNGVPSERRRCFGSRQPVEPQ
jgi:hypothetical protein